MLKKRTIIIALILIFILTVLFSSNYRFSPTGMVVSDVYNLDYVLNNLNEFKDKYNSNIDKVPGFVKIMFGDEKIDLIITKIDETKVKLSVETKNGLVEKATTEQFDEYTLNVWVDERTINEIIESEDQIMRLKQALDNEEIKYEALTFKTSLKTGISKIILTIYSWFAK